eukprot:CAMPEP_0114347622 /NCGR_PEP_ID=MMETSP0101-20121206/14056_1 /TAXON_ID=38822 ORGANISM="Pteridomonas danica, Strain PT" /NCGR_SAMPLE_ID=MMETSP0101 /ASSEMBLY_ACC=CAM_ASM_000211 /LENGTH=141 /DNA_ID=CAMNT_0001485059 /DNA_START=224 /DNA_END=646 /DNA_ORIENTATION=-
MKTRKKNNQKKGYHHENENENENDVSGDVSEEEEVVTIAVHIRRGDVTKTDQLRYLDNLYYYRCLQAVIQAYTTPTTPPPPTPTPIIDQAPNIMTEQLRYQFNIHIFSEVQTNKEDSFEQLFNNFSQTNDNDNDNNNKKNN